MLQGEARNQVDRIWEIFWTGGITNPLEVIEQFTYLLFIKQLDDMETEKESNAVMFGVEYHGMFDAHPEYRWSHFRQLGSPEEMFALVADGVFPFIKTLHPDGDSAYAKYMGDAVFKIPTAAMLVKVIEGIDQLDLAGEDSKGDLYEYLLSKLVNEEHRAAKFVSSICCIFPDGSIIRTEGECRGEILREPSGEGGFGYDPVFMPQGYDRSMAELGTEVKNRISHRANALREFKKKLRELNGTYK